MILIIDNTLNLNTAYMTPKIINILSNCGAMCVIVSSKEELHLINKPLVKGIILSGGPRCLSNNALIKDIELNTIVLNIFNNIPILGICFGFQVICNLYGSPVKSLGRTINQIIDIPINPKLTLSKNNTGIIPAFFSHSDYIEHPPNGFIYSQHNNMIIAIEHTVKPIYGYQFHPENGPATDYIVKNFLHLIFDKFDKII